MSKSSSPTVPTCLNGLNREQRRAVVQGFNKGQTTNIKAVLIIAGAGSGKTKTLAHRVSYIINRGIDPRRILLLTFSRRAAQEMTDRVRRIAADALNGRQIDLPWSGTFHAIGAKLIRQYANQLGVHPSFTILDRSDAADLLGLVRHDLGLGSKELPFPAKETCLSIYSLMVNSQIALKELLEREFPSQLRWRRELRILFKKYEKAKQTQNVLDYDDLLFRWLDLMNVPAVAYEIRGYFDHAFVDEYQDTNALQAEILFRLMPNGRGLTVVGDDAQAIYSFRGATVRNILDFPSRCEPTAKVISLEQNYRSTQPILKASNKVIAFAADRYTKNLYSQKNSKQKPFLTMVSDERAQARYVAQQIIDARVCGTPLRQQAVLFRASSSQRHARIRTRPAQDPVR